MFLLVPAYPGCPGPKAVKLVCVCVCMSVCTCACACVCVCVHSVSYMIYIDFQLIKNWPYDIVTTSISHSSPDIHLHNCQTNVEY